MESGKQRLASIAYAEKSQEVIGASLQDMVLGGDSKMNTDPLRR